MTEAKVKLSDNSYLGKSLFMTLSGQLHMQNSKVTIDNVMQDTSDFTKFARSNIAFSDVTDQNYERYSDYDKALKFVTKAFKISGDDYYKQRMDIINKK